MATASSSGNPKTFKARHGHAESDSNDRAGWRGVEDALVAKWQRDDLRRRQAQSLTKYRDPWDVFEPRRPFDIACDLAGECFLGGTWTQLPVADPSMVELGHRVVRFLHEFDRVRTEAPRGKKEFWPSRRALIDAFGDDAELVEAAWPAIRFVEPLMTISEPDRRKKLQQEAWILLDMLQPNKFVVEGVRGLLLSAAKRITSKRRRLLNELPGLVNEALVGGRSRERMLAGYPPSAEPWRAFEHWLDCSRNRMRDAAGGVIELGDGHGRARSTLRRWKAEDKSAVSAPKVTLAERARQNDLRRRHYDVGGSSLTASQIADRWERPETTVRKAVRSAIEAGAVPEKRLPGTKSYALSRKEWEHVKPFMPRSRT